MNEKDTGQRPDLRENGGYDGAPYPGPSSRPAAQMPAGYMPPYQPPGWGYGPPGMPAFPVRLKRKDLVRRFANRVGVFLMAQHAAMFVLSLVMVISVSLVLLLLDENPLTSFLFTDENGFGMQLLNLLIYVVSFVVPFALYLRFRRVKLSTLVSFKKPDIGLGFLFFPLGLVLNMAGGYLANLIIFGLNQFGYDVPSASSDIPQEIAAYLVYFLMVVILAPLIEEVVFRGVIMGDAGRFGAVFAILFSSLVFAVMHGTIEQIPAVFPLAILIGAAVVISDSIWTGVFIHFLNNLVAVGFSTLYEVLPNEICRRVDSAFTIIMVILAVVSLIYMFTNAKFKARFHSRIKGKLPGPTLKKALLSPGMIAFYALMLVTILFSIEKIA